MGRDDVRWHSEVTREKNGWVLAVTMTHGQSELVVALPLDAADEAAATAEADQVLASLRSLADSVS